jgi:hypothetical protein
MGQIESARPELLRAYQCQQDAVDENARRIEAAQKEADASKQKQQVEKARSDKKMNAEIDNVMSDLEGFTFYADYVNPFTVYLDGLYFLYAGVDGSDLERATKSLKRVQEIAPDNKFLQVDLATAEAVIGGQPPTPTTYVIFETGQAASRDQIRIDIPIIVTSVSYVGVAFPRLAFHPNNETALTVQAGDVSEQTQTIANMDAIVALDFKNEWPVILTKTMVSTIAKGVAAYAANEAARQVNSTFGLLTRIGTAIAQASVNIADTRTWSTLPREIQMARVATPPDRTLTLSTPTGGQTAVTVGEGTINLVYVKSISAGGPMMLVNQFKLK